MSRTRGYTVVELIVTLGLVSVVVLAAGQLISGAGRLLVSADRRVEDPRVGALSTTLPV